MESWYTRLSFSPIDRVMVAKIMQAPGWEPALKRIEAKVQSFIWNGGIPKVAKATLRLPKNEGVSWYGP
jgi:hypothetical protein